MREVAIVGGGPAGAMLAARLARSGLDVVLIERAPAWRWRAAGVFASPAAVDALRRSGLDSDRLARVARPIPAMHLETLGGVVVPIAYGTERGGPPAVGFDRSALDPALVALARSAGATIWTGVEVRHVTVRPDGRGATLQLRGGQVGPILEAAIVIGADGPRSVVARTTGVARAVRLAPRVGLSYHVADPRGDVPVPARIRVLEDGYVGIAPVPGGRLNVGIVLGSSWAAALKALGAGAVAARIVAGIPPSAEDDGRWRESRPCDAIAGSAPLGVRVTHRAGPGWFLVGDAAGFLDPFTGEGIHRAIVSTELAAPAIVAAVRGRASADAAAAAYDRSMRRRFAAKDAVSLLVQAFLARNVLLEYAARRLSTRSEARATMGLVIGDLVPATRGLDPRFLASVLAP